jgi:diguanylate cyclase (GGDEF)-like protein/PAS domain S-box-containing protein
VRVADVTTLRDGTMEALQVRGGVLAEDDVRAGSADDAEPVLVVPLQTAAQAAAYTSPFAPGASPVPADARTSAYGGAAFVRSPVAMAVVDGTGAVLEVNPALARYLGHPVDALVGTVLHAHVAPEDVGRLRLGTTERRLRHARGHDLWAVVSAVPMPEAGAGAALVVLDDATSRRNTERMLLHAALHDSLTNLPNRRLLRDRLETALTRAHRTSARVAVLFVDLDKFKEVNDTFGHDVGDEVLVSVSTGILGALRSNDTVARLGGDEFVVVAEDLSDDDDLVALVERLQAGIGRPVNVRGRQIRVRASVGVAIDGTDATTGEQLMRLADLAMMRAKRHPELPFVVADDTIGDDTLDDGREGRGLVAELRHAIQADLLQLHYQPVVSVEGRLIGLEALVRWPHPRLGLLMPEDFLPRVEGTPLAQSLTDWVLRAAVSDAASWHDPSVRVSVNVWADEVARPGFADTVALLLTWAGLQARGLYLELREQDLPEAGPALPDELDRLRRLGVGLAIDDFGSGGTSLAGLRRLPVDTLKVDRTFVAGCVDDPEDGAVVAAVATAARAAGRHPLAAGVETAEQLRVLKSLGYESVQGYLTGAPAPLIDLRPVLAHRRVELPG